MNHSNLYVSVSPHVHSGNSIRKMNLNILWALIPIIFAGWYFFGWPALKVVSICALSALVADFLWQKTTGTPVFLKDGSALISGLLLGLILSSEVPWWVCILAAFVAMIIGRQLFGGMGNHPFNSVLVGWTFVQISYPGKIENFPMPDPLFFLEPGRFLADPPLVTLSEDFDMLLDLPLMDLFLGNVPGVIGAVSVLAILLGGAYLLLRRIITWHIPVSFILSAWIFAYIFWKIDPQAYAHPTFHILSGWVMLGAFFLAPEKGTAPVTTPGMIVYGIGCGAIAMIIRIWGVYIEGVPFAILFMNGTTPLLDRIRSRAVGRVKSIA